MPPLRVCCLALHAYPAIEPADPGRFGGTETRAWLLARGLARIGGMEVSMVVRSRRPPVRQQYHGVRIIRRPQPLYWVPQTVSSYAEGLPRFPWVRIRRWSTSLLWQLPVVAAMRLLRQRRPDPRRPDRFFRRLEADVFCSFGVHIDSARLIAAQKAAGRKSVLLLGADSDLDERFSPESTYVTPYGERGYVCWFALHNADRIVVQTEWQQWTLKERFGRESVVLSNPIDVSEWEAAQASRECLPEAQGLRRYALWVGRADSFHKRPMLCLELARRCPEVDFLMIAIPRDRAVEEQLRRTRPANVRLVEWVPYARMPLVFRDAAMLVNTSSAAYEGFPNVFLQAGASGVPIASLELDYGFVGARQCGLAAGGDLDRLAEYVRSVWNDPRRGAEQGTRGRQYVRELHDLPAVASRFAEVLRGTISGRLAVE